MRFYVWMSANSVKTTTTPAKPPGPADAVLIAIVRPAFLKLDGVRCKIILSKLYRSFLAATVHPRYEHPRNMTDDTCYKYWKHNALGTEWWTDEFARDILRSGTWLHCFKIRNEREQKTA